MLQMRILFLSTHSVRSATRHIGAAGKQIIKFLSTHSVRSATSFLVLVDCLVGSISIHALRKECDAVPVELVYRHNDISIHALRKECDLSAVVINDDVEYFYPRTP